MSGRKLTDMQELFVREYLVDLNATQAALRAGYSLPECDGCEQKCYVYLLVDPSTGEIFYVGKGTGRRYMAHEAEWRGATGSNGAKLARFSEVMAASGWVATLCFASGLTDDEAYQVERAVIDAIGVERLTNATPGISTQPGRAALMLSQVKPFDQWVKERPRSDYHIELYHKVVEGLAEMAAHG